MLAIDIGGTKLAAGIVDPHGGVHAEARAATPRSDDAEVVYAALTSLVDQVVASTSLVPVACGVGCGGPMGPGGEDVSPLNIPAWRRFPLRGRLARSVGLPVTVDNDAKALALGEGWLGAAAGRADYLAMVVSTGVGAGILLDGRLLDGAHGNAGHIGHVIVEPEGRTCACGARGCLEAEASGPSIAAATGRPPAEAPPDVRRRTGTLVGRAVASVANLLDLDLAVVAGSVALGFGRPFFEAAQAEVDARARLDFSRGTRIVPAGLGARGPLLGAAAVGWRAVARTGGGPGATGAVDGPLDGPTAAFDPVPTTGGTAHWAGGTVPTTGGTASATSEAAPTTGGMAPAAGEASAAGGTVGIAGSAVTVPITGGPSPHAPLRVVGS